MTYDKFLKLMKFPKEWMEWEMIPDELASIQIEGYEPGHEDASEHDRNGAFHWWLKRYPSNEQLEKLTKLARLDPDQAMASDVREHIDKLKQSLGSE